MLSLSILLNLWCLFKTQVTFTDTNVLQNPQSILQSNRTNKSLQNLKQHFEPSPKTCHFLLISSCFFMEINLILNELVVSFEPSTPSLHHSGLFRSVIYLTIFYFICFSPVTFLFNFFSLSCVASFGAFLEVSFSSWN